MAVVGNCTMALGVHDNMGDLVLLAVYFWPCRMTVRVTWTGREEALYDFCCRAALKGR